MIPLADVMVDRYKFKLPAKEKIEAVKQYYNEHGEMDKPVSVSCHGDKYMLEDKYL